jgi:hypothetical protein
MSKYQNFIFEGYELNAQTKELSLKYSFDGTLDFTEVYKFDFEWKAGYDSAALDRACQLVFFLAGISYFKAYLASSILVKAGQVDEIISQFLGKTYQKGLGEFFYVNGLDPKTTIDFPINAKSPERLSVKSNGLLLGIGGGKDSLVSVELLRDKIDLMTWSLNHRPQLAPLVERIGLPHSFVERKWDTKLLELNKQDALNGHIPISAIIASVGTVVSVLTGLQDNVVSNESSASEPNLTYRGVEINHQYSKSLEFERDFQACLQHLFGDSLRYYSLLRPLSELRIAELFAQTGFEKYKGVFSSCNKAFTHFSDHIFWDGTCPKCAFVFLALTPFVERKKLEDLFGGKNLLLDNGLEQTYRQLLGIEGDKPLECVGEVKESRSAMIMAQKIYPELTKYQFELPADYDFRAIGPHLMPDKIAEIIIQMATF